ncbi:DUF2790 domain-containing protein [Pseudomonas sp. NA-150]|uniref:DUF2790 domain-containing protein n=1 Tax=Pseudomonas sp. NA-150 TaxID=3367525 RepID=UPI0037C82426
MKKLLVIGLSLVSLYAGTSYATEAASEPRSDETLPVEHYEYGKKLDIAKVLHTSVIPKICGPIRTHMIYQDSKGLHHDLEYSVIGDGCHSNGID